MFFYKFSLLFFIYFHIFSLLSLIFLIIIYIGFKETVTIEVVTSLNPYRREMVTNILCTFYILAGALYSEDPLPAYLPDAKSARKKLTWMFRHHPAGLFVF